MSDGKTSSAPKRNWLAFKVLIGIAAAMGIYSFVVNAPSFSRSRGSSDEDGVQIAPLVTSGHLTVDNQKWVGVSCLDPTKRIDIKMLTLGVRWQIRVNGDDHQVYTLYPAGWKEKSHFELPSEFNLLECRIHPDEPITRGTAVWTISPKRRDT